VGCSGCLPEGDLKGFSVFLLNPDPSHDSILPLLTLMLHTQTGKNR
jgi:hypothetical protein